MKPKPLPPLDYLQACFDLDPTCPSGLRWRKRHPAHFANWRGGNQFNKQFAGKPAGNLGKRGYWAVEFGLPKKIYKAHRIIYFMHYGVDPGDSIVDHRDGVTTNNNPNNLRLATSVQNGANSKRGERTHLKGVYHYKNRYRAKIERFIGSFKTPEEASAAYQAVSAILDKEFALHLSRDLK